MSRFPREALWSHGDHRTLGANEMTAKRWTRMILTSAISLAAASCTNGEVSTEDLDVGQDTRERGADAATTRDAASSTDPGDPRDAGPTVDASAPDATPRLDASGDAGEEPGDADTAGDLVPVFVAQGHVGRTTISCDDGQTWIADRAFDSEGHPLACGQTQAVQCYETGCDFVNDGTCENRASCDCDHHPGAGRGVTWGDGWFVTTWGWGPAGGLMRSRDAITWEMVHGGTTFAGVVFGNGRFVTGGRRPLVSSDSGATWSNLGDADIRTAAGETVHNPRSLGFAEGVFVLTGSSGDSSGMVVSTDGATWTRPDPLPDACSQSVRGAGAVGARGAIVLLTGDGDACVSTDQGASFQHAMGAGTFDTGVVHDGEAFLAWGDRKRWRSTDGLTWTSEDTSPPLSLASVARHPDTGTLVASNRGWKQWYDAQRFYRSTDGGLTWDELSEGSYTGSHPIRAIGVGWAPASQACPAPQGR